jgi:hypothetical protein
MIAALLNHNFFQWCHRDVIHIGWEDSLKWLPFGRAELLRGRNASNCNCNKFNLKRARGPAAAGPYLIWFSTLSELYPSQRTTISWFFPRLRQCDTFHTLMSRAPVKTKTPGSKDSSKDDIQKRVLLRLAASPVVLAPVMLGFMSMVSAWAFNFKSAGLFVFGGIAGILIGGGTFLSKLLLSGKSTAQKVLTEVEQEQHLAHQSELDQLEQVLIHSDRDPRPEEALRDLRALVATFEGLEKNAPSAQWSIMVDVRLQVESLFSHSVRLLEQTHRLWETAEKLSSQVAKQPVIDQREQIIHEIQSCVKQLSHSLVSLQKLGHVEASTVDLKKMRQELDTSLEVARKVEARMKGWNLGAEQELPGRI